MAEQAPPDSSGAAPPDGFDTRGLPMVSPPDPAALAEERAWLAENDAKPRLARWAGYLRKGGPGYLQSALTLGGGSASASLFAGAAFGYQLLWVAPTAMLIGMVMMMAIAHQTLSTGMRPFEAMRSYAGVKFAYGWAIGAMLASIIWHFSQYALASVLVTEIASQADITMSKGIGGGIVLAWALLSSQLFASGSRGMLWFDRLLKILVWLFVVLWSWLPVCLLGYHTYLLLTNQTTWEFNRKTRITYLRKGKQSEIDLKVIERPAAATFRRR